MTLCVALATPRMVIQASDRRVSMMRGGRIVDRDDHRNKAVIFTVGSLRTLITFCGVATLEGLATDRWIARTLSSIVANPANHPRLWHHFSETLSKAYTASILKSGLRRHIGLDIIVTGFSLDLAINIVFQTLSDGRVRVTNTTPGDLPVKTAFHRYFMVRAIGSGSGLFCDRYLERLRFLGKAGRFKPKNMERLRDLLTDMIKGVSSDPRSGDLVGNNCIVSAILFPAKFVMKYSPMRAGDPHVYAPIIVENTTWVEMSLKRTE